MKTRWLLGGVVAVVLFAWSSALGGLAEGSPYVEIWTDRGDGGVYRVGDCARICFRPAYDCYVIVYEIDTDGYLRVLFPYDCWDDGYVVGGELYTIGAHGSRRLYVHGPSGVEYIHVVASFKPFRRIYWHGCDGYEEYAIDVSWRGFADYWGCALPPRVYGDPYMAMQAIDEFICLDALEAGIVWADFTYFYVERKVHYPRYICYDCHGFRPYVRPYVDICLGFSITFVDCHPCYRPCSWWWWCTPKRRYCGPRYVCYSKKQSGRYPSLYKWKSRTSTYTGEAAKHKTGNIIDASRVKSKQRQKDMSLYAKREPRGATKDKKREVRQQEPAGQRHQAETTVRERYRSRNSKSPSEVTLIRSAKKSKKAQAKDTKVTRSSRRVASRARAKPEVRSTKIGKSSATRRRISR